jgi:pimeloyl-ACP methyl ester carboxylesterase
MFIQNNKKIIAMLDDFLLERIYLPDEFSTSDSSRPCSPLTALERCFRSIPSIPLIPSFPTLKRIASRKNFESVEIRPLASGERAFPGLRGLDMEDEVMAMRSLIRGIQELEFASERISYEPIKGALSSVEDPEFVNVEYAMVNRAKISDPMSVRHIFLWPGLNFDAIQEYYDVIRHLAEDCPNDYIYAPNIPGIGWRKFGIKDGVTQIANVAEAFVRRLAGDYLANVFSIGHSFGAWCGCYELARRIPEIAGIMPVNSPGFTAKIPAKFRFGASFFMRPFLEKVVFPMNREGIVALLEDGMTIKKLDPQLIDSYMRSLRSGQINRRGLYPFRYKIWQTHPLEFTVAINRIVSQTVFSDEQLESLRPFVFAVVGEHEKLTNPGAGDGVFTRYRLIPNRLHLEDDLPAVVRGVMHVPMLEDPDVFRKLMKVFFLKLISHQLIIS